MQRNLQNISLAELEIIGILAHYQSLRALARDLKVTVSNISTKISKLENELGKEIIKRTARGYTLTQDGTRLAKIAAHILQECEALVSESHKPEFMPERWITIGTRGFLNSLFAPLFLDAGESAKSSIGFRFVDFSPEELVVAAFRASLDVAITLEQCFLGERWESFRVGETQRVLLVRNNHPLVKGGNISMLANYKVLRSAYWDGNRIVSSPDALPSVKKHWGHEIQTAATAIPVVQESDCVAFLPRIAAARALKEGTLVEIFRKETPVVKMPIYLHVNRDTIQKKFYVQIRSMVENAVLQYG